MPSAVVYWTVTVCPLGADSVTVKVRFFVPEFPSTTERRRSRCVGSGSSSRIVARPWLSAMTALIARAQVDEERLVDLVARVGDADDVDRLDRLARGEDQRAAGGDVVAAGGGRAVGGRVVHLDLERRGGRQRDREDGGERAVVPLGDGHVADRQAHVVGEDRADALAVHQDGVDRVAQVEEQRLVGSSAVSPLMTTVTVRLVWPGVKVSVPLAAV